LLLIERLDKTFPEPEKPYQKSTDWREGRGKNLQERMLQFQQGVTLWPWFHNR